MHSKQKKFEMLSRSGSNRVKVSEQQPFLRACRTSILLLDEISSADCFVHGQWKGIKSVMIARV